MKKLTTIAICLFISSAFLTSSAKAQQVDSLKKQLAEKWVNAKAYTLKMAELMPEDKYDFKPVPDVMSFREQLLHIAQNIEWLSTTYLVPEKLVKSDDKGIKSKSEILQILTNAYDKGLAAHNKLSEKNMDEMVSFFAGPKSKRQILVLMHDHQTHHVGQIIVYLRLNGIKPPAYVGW